MREKAGVRRATDSEKALLTVGKFDLLQGVPEDFCLLFIFHLGSIFFHVQHDLTRIRLTDRFQDQGQGGFQAGNFCRQGFNVRSVVKSQLLIISPQAGCQAALPTLYSKKKGVYQRAHPKRPGAK